MGNYSEVKDACRKPRFSKKTFCEKDEKGISTRIKFRLTFILSIDILLHTVCLIIRNKNEQSLDVNYLLKESFIIFACLDGCLLLITIHTTIKGSWVLWKIIRGFYISSLCTSWFVNVQSMYQQRQHDSELGFYLWFGGFVTLVLPFSYFYYLTAIKQDQKPSRSNVDPSTMLSSLKVHPYEFYTIFNALIHPAIYLILERIKVQQRTVHYFHTYYQPQQTFSS